MKKFFIGIDVSKRKLDLCCIAQGEIITECIVENDLRSIKTHFQEVLKNTSINVSELLICAEYTGQYTYPLSCICVDLGIDLWIENPNQIKYRSGFRRGKNDKLDARMIAMYSLKFHDQAILFSIPEAKLESLKQLIRERDLYVVDRGKYQGQMKDQKNFMAKDDYEKKSKRLTIIIEEFNNAIIQIEKDIQSIISNDETLLNQHRLLCSVDGIGERTAIKMIVETNAFKDFTNPRKFCCHAGVAPFEYTSGSSKHSKNRVSNQADKSIKALLHMGALVVATRMKGELNAYYTRKVDEGKNKMSVINAIRAKLVYRMFAVIRNNQVYQINYLNSLA